MMRLRDATLRVAAANKVALEAEQQKDAPEKEVQDLKRELGSNLLARDHEQRLHDRSQ